jgi:hypothetical protein
MSTRTTMSNRGAAVGISIRDRILSLLGEKPGLSDREITDQILGKGGSSFPSQSGLSSIADVKTADA